MADEVEKVEYSFDGDASSLKSATNAALALLKQYSKAVDVASSKETFKVSKKSTSSMQSAIGSVTKEIEKMQKSMQSANDVQLPNWSSAYKGLESVLKTLDGNIYKVANSSRMSTKEFNAIRDSLKATKGTLQEAAQNVDKVAQSEQRFQATNKALETALGTAASKFRDFSGGALGTVRNALSALSSRFDPITSRIQSFQGHAQQAFQRAGTLAQTCASAFRRVSQASNEDADAARKAATAQEGLSDTMQDVAEEAQDVDKAQEDSAEASDKMADATTKASSKSGNFGAALQRLSGLLSRSTSSIKNLGNSFKSLTSLSRQVTSALRTITSVDFSNFLSEGITSAINMAESINLFEVAMGEAAETGQAFVSRMSEIYGLDPKTLYDTAGLFYQLTDAMGASTSASTNMSLSLTKATTDLASLFNRDFETVAEDLTAGIQGQTKAVRKYGLDIRVATLEQTALKYGITKNIDTMSEANRQALRTITMLDQMSNATTQLTTDAEGNAVALGDFANTIETPANQLRIFGEQMAQLGRAIGNYFVVPISKAMAYVNGFVMALRTAISFIGTFLGVVEDTVDTSGGLENTEEAVNGIGKAADSTAKKLKDMTAPFDELNVLQEKKASGGSEGVSISGEGVDPALETALANMSLKLEDITMKANKVRDALLGFFGFKVDAGKIIGWNADDFEKNLIEKFPQWTKTIQAVFDNWSSIFAGFKSVLSSLGQVFDAVITKIKNFIKQFVNDDSTSSWISGLGDSLKGLSDWISKHSDGLADLIIIIGSLAIAFRVLAPLAAKISNLVQTCSKLYSVLGSVGGASGTAATGLLKFFGIVGIVIAALVLLWTQSETFRNAVVQLGQTLWTNLQEPLAAIGTAFTTLKTDVASLWTDSFQPLVNNVGEFLAPVLGTLGTLLGDVLKIFTSLTNGATTMWHNYVKPTLAETAKAISRVVDILKDVWEDTVGPILARVGAVLVDLWTNYIQPIVEDVTAVVHNIGLVLLGLWNNILYPIVKFLWGVLGPVVNWVVDFIVGLVQWLVKIISTVVKAITGILKGITDFLAGGFTGDWKKCLSGLVNIFVAIGNLIIGIAEGLVNAIILVLNTLWGAIYAAVAAIVNSIGGLIEGIASVVGIDIEVGMSAKAPLIPDLHIPRIPEMAFAKGGVVTGPTRALIGEGAYDEAVIPLGNSPQMQDLVNKIADAVDKKDPSSGGPTEVRVFIGDKEWDAFTYKSAKRGEKLVGAQPIKEE